MVVWVFEVDVFEVEVVSVRDSVVVPVVVPVVEVPVGSDSSWDAEKTSSTMSTSPREWE